MPNLDDSDETGVAMGTGDFTDDGAGCFDGGDYWSKDEDEENIDSKDDRTRIMQASSLTIGFC